MSRMTAWILYFSFSAVSFGAEEILKNKSALIFENTFDYFAAMNQVGMSDNIED